MQSQGNDEEEAALTLGASGLADLLPREPAQDPLGAALRRRPLQRPGDGGVRRRLGGLGAHPRASPTRCPLHVEILYNEYQFAAAFAVASLLTLLALVTLAIKSVIEWRTRVGAMLFI